MQLLEPSSSRSSVLLVSAAGATVDRHRTGEEAELARRSGLGVVVLGVGRQVNGSEASTMASQGDDGVLYADTFAHLLDTDVQFTRLLADKICGRRALVDSHLG